MTRFQMLLRSVTHLLLLWSVRQPHPRLYKRTGPSFSELEKMCFADEGSTQYTELGPRATVLPFLTFRAIAFSFFTGCLPLGLFPKEHEILTTVCFKPCTTSRDGLPVTSQHRRMRFRSQRSDHMVGTNCPKSAFEHPGTLS